VQKSDGWYLEKLTMSDANTLKIGFLMSALVLLAACSANHEERHWTEDVQLEDGSIVQIERHVEFDATNAMGGGAGNAVETRATLAFKGELSSLPVWDFPRIALVLYQSKQNQRWVVVSATTSCEVWQRGNRPRPPYWQHDMVDGQWKQAPLAEESIGKKTNLFYRYWKDDFPEHVTPQETKDRQSSPGVDKFYKQIVASDAGWNC
jgi:hypothetical protein